MNEVSARGAQTALGNGASLGAGSSAIMLSCNKCTNGNKVTVEFPDASFTFHAQWLHDARCDNGAARNAATAICQQPISTVHVEKVELSGEGIQMTLDVTWDDQLFSSFPGIWLRVLAPLVGRCENAESIPTLDEAISEGWQVDGLQIPEISYRDIFLEADGAAPNQRGERSRDDLTLEALNKLLGASSPGIIKVVDLPAPNFEDERINVK